METHSQFLNSVTAGDCLSLLPDIGSRTADFVLTDPPYIASYRPRDGRTLINDNNGEWLEPAFSELYRVLKPDSFCFSFYGWPQPIRTLA